MAHLQTRLGIELAYGQAHDASRDGNLRRRETRGVEHDEPRSPTALATAQGIRGELRHERVLVAQDVARRAHAALHVRIAFLRNGHEAVTHVVA